MSTLEMHLKKRMLGSLFQGEPEFIVGFSGSGVIISESEFKDVDFILTIIGDTYVVGRPVGNSEKEYFFPIDKVRFYYYQDDINEEPTQPFLVKLLTTLESIEDDIRHASINNFLKDPTDKN